VRGGVRSEKTVKLKEMPREKGDGYDVIYGSVTTHGARLRTIVTRPKAAGRHPAVMMLQGSGCWSVDTTVGPANGFTWITRDLARRGYVTLRVDRPGCGDSEGGPCRDVDFNTELDGYRHALQALKGFDFVEQEDVFLFGHSQGGVVAPLLAVDLPVRGIAVFGTASATWFESIFGQRRRLASLDGTPAGDIDREVLDQGRFWYPLLVEKKTPREIREQIPEARKALEAWVKDDKYVGERHYLFHHQVSERNLPDVWSRVKWSKPETEAPHPRVLAMWGTTDWVSNREANAWIVEVVNRAKPGTGSLVTLDSVDHFFFHAASPEESYRIWKGGPAKGFNPVVLKTLHAWLDEPRRK
jgi:pimeloyl-ACP methyl ester carboxylesterase